MEPFSKDKQLYILKSLKKHGHLGQEFIRKKLEEEIEHIDIQDSLVKLFFLKQKAHAKSNRILIRPSHIMEGLADKNVFVQDENFARCIYELAQKEMATDSLYSISTHCLGLLLPCLAEADIRNLIKKRITKNNRPEFIHRLLDLKKMPFWLHEYVKIHATSIILDKEESYIKRLVMDKYSRLNTIAIEDTPQDENNINA